MLATEHYCDCAKYCKQRKKVSKTTFYDHAKHRHPISQSINEFAAGVGTSLQPPSNSLRGDHAIQCNPLSSPRHPTRKKRRMDRKRDADEMGAPLQTGFMVSCKCTHEIISRPLISSRIMMRMTLTTMTAIMKPIYPAPYRCQQQVLTTMIVTVIQGIPIHTACLILIALMTSLSYLLLSLPLQQRQCL